MVLKKTDWEHQQFNLSLLLEYDQKVYDLERIEIWYLVRNILLHFTFLAQKIVMMSNTFCLWVKVPVEWVYVM